MNRRIVLAAILAAAILCALAAPAAAHVSVDPASAPKGATAKLSFLVPNEEPTKRVTRLQVLFPTPPDTPIATVTVEQKPGWTARVRTQNLAQPIVTDDGSVTRVVREIEWTANTVADGIAANHFGEFTVAADGLPDDENEVVFKAVQTYSDASVVRWIDPVTPGGPEAEHPTPILELTEPVGATTPSTSEPPSGNVAIVAAANDDSARALGIIGIALGAVALLFATAALMRRRRS